MEDPLRMREPAAFTREREVFNLFAAFRDIPQVEDLGLSPETHAIPSHYKPKPASDASLAAFCQLAALRLQASRSLISLLDEKNQYILAEATPRTSLKFDSPLNRTVDLGFGNVCLPRRWGICERVLDPVALAEGEEGIVVINDLTKSSQHADRSYVRDGPLRFYAGVPLRTSSGNIVGSVCILDDKTRDGLPQEDVQYLQDLASVVMDYLHTYTIKDRYRRGAEGLHGLMSFAEGASTLQAFGEQYQTPNPTPTLHMATQTTKTNGIFQKSSVNSAQDLNSQEPDRQENASSEFTQRKHPSRQDSLTELQDSLLPATIKHLFARAAEIMHKSNDLDGVMFMDASVAAIGLQELQPDSTGKLCQILGFATNDSSSLKGQILPKEMTPSETNFKWILEQYPNGYSLDCEESGASSEVIDSTDRTESSCRSANNIRQRPGLQKAMKDRTRHVERVQALIPNIKSALFLPLWDFDRARWFAGCFCWSTRSERALDGRLELPFLKAFGHSIMQEVARLDALTTDHAKTTFLSSLSHELRTPLHGILGSTHLLRNTTLDSFQSSMINSITVCGRTLLETVEHLLDHAERRESSRHYSSKIISGENRICITSERLASGTPITPSEKTSAVSKCNLGFVTEELVETMSISQSPFDLGHDPTVCGEPKVDQGMRRAVPRRRSRYLILDIKDYESLGFYVSASSYGRIVMNLFGNALKFTDSGFVHVSLRSEHMYGPNATVILSISDSGTGMSKYFLENNAFEPFRKQNQHTPGTGVGLSVVKRILEDIGGQLEVESELSKGTEITLRLPLERLSEEESHRPVINPLPAMIAGLKGRKVCIYPGSYDSNESTDQTGHQKTLIERYIEVLCTTLSSVLGLEVGQATVWDGSNDADVVICPEVSFESLQIIRNTAVNAQKRCPATVFIAMDVLEAETLRSDARVTSKESIVESIIQPCGPYKLAMVLNQCFQSYDAESERPCKNPTTLSDDTSGTADPIAIPPRLDLYSPPPFPILTKTDSPLEDIVTLISPPKPQDATTNANDCTIKPALIVDDNAINRRVLSAWMKKNEIPFKQAVDGLQALETYKESGGTFDVVLMDISMPVMDGMTSTRLIREYEKENNLAPAHIIALTGLTSASAKLEAWTSGVDDFLTKPVNFKKLEKVLAVGRGVVGTGFTKEQGD